MAIYWLFTFWVMPFQLPPLSLYQGVCHFKADINSQKNRNKKQILPLQNALMITTSLDQLSLAKATENVPQASQWHARHVWLNLTCISVQSTIQGWPTGLSCHGNPLKRALDCLHKTLLSLSSIFQKKIVQLCDSVVVANGGHNMCWRLVGSSCYYYSTTTLEQGQLL